MSDDRIWLTYGGAGSTADEGTITVTNESSDVQGAAVTIAFEGPGVGYSQPLTIGEALLLAEMLTSNARAALAELNL